ncbi:unnamed protein product [Urochloa humidicola]
MDSNKNVDATVSLIVVAEDAAAATAEPAAPEGGGGGERRLALLLDRLRSVIFVRPAAMCALVAFHLALSAYEARSWVPWLQGRLPTLPAFALGYAAVAALMWFDWWLEEPQRRRPLDARERRVKLAARILASAVVGVLAYWTASPSPCGLLLFIWYFGSE